MLQDIEKLALIPSIISGLLAYAVTPVVIKIAWKFGLIDDPKGKAHPKIIHTKPIPRAGGLAVYIAILVSAIAFLPLDKHLVGILLGATILVALGLADDKWKLSPYFRLIIQFIAAAAPIAAGIGIAFVSNPFGGTYDLSMPRITFSLLGSTHSIWLLSDLFALFWIVVIMNFLNIGAKGVDGQLPGVVGIAAVTIALLSLKFSADITEWPVIILASITAGSFFGFLPWNAFPQKIMPAFSGSNLAGYMLAVLAILSTTKVGTLTVVLAVPLIDTGYVVARRILAGKSPVWGDDRHLHHKLLKNGWSKKKIAAFYWAVTAVLGLAALGLNTTTKLYTMVAAGAFVGGFILWLTYRPKSNS